MQSYCLPVPEYSYYDYPEISTEWSMNRQNRRRDTVAQNTESKAQELWPCNNIQAPMPNELIQYSPEQQLNYNVLIRSTKKELDEDFMKTRLPSPPKSSETQFLSRFEDIEQEKKLGFSIYNSKQCYERRMDASNWNNKTEKYTLPLVPRLQNIVNDNGKITKRSVRQCHIPPDVMAKLIAGPFEGKLKFTCLYKNCGKQFSRKYNIQSHIQTHLSDRPYRCQQCKAGFVRQHDLRRHCLIHGGDEAKSWICQCGKAFGRGDALTRHRQRNICKGGIGNITKNENEKPIDDSNNIYPD